MIAPDAHAVLIAFDKILDQCGLFEFIQNALDAGVKFYICSASLELNDISQTELIDRADNLVSSIFLTKKGLESDLVLSF